jgi:hypothetical protein
MIKGLLVLLMTLIAASTVTDRTIVDKVFGQRSVGETVDTYRLMAIVFKGNDTRITIETSNSDVLKKEFVDQIIIQPNENTTKEINNMVESGIDAATKLGNKDGLVYEAMVNSTKTVATCQKVDNTIIWSINTLE